MGVLITPLSQIGVILDNCAKHIDPLSICSIAVLAYAQSLLDPFSIRSRTHFRCTFSQSGALKGIPRQGGILCQHFLDHYEKAKEN